MEVALNVTVKAGTAPLQLERLKVTLAAKSSPEFGRNMVRGSEVAIAGLQVSLLSAASNELSVRALEHESEIANGCDISRQGRELS